MTFLKRTNRCLCALALLLAAGCGKKEAEETTPAAGESSVAQTPIDETPPAATGKMPVPPAPPNFTPPPPPTGVPPGLGGPSSPKVAELQAILRKANPAYQGQGKFHEENGEIVAAELANCNLSDLSPLKGLSLFGMDISGNPVREIRHLKGMPLRNLFMENTLVTDLSPLNGAPIVELRLNGTPLQSLKGLEGMPVENLYMLGTKVTDISALAGSKLRQLWLNETPISDLAPLAGAPIVSLTLHRTQVSDLSFIRNLPVIQRLHIADTPVTDLTPLKGVPLTRLVFTPAKIEKGLEVARQLFGLREIGTRFDDQSRDLMPPDQFWSRFDNGEFR